MVLSHKAAPGNLSLSVFNGLDPGLCRGDRLIQGFPKCFCRASILASIMVKSSSFGLTNVQ